MTEEELRQEIKRRFPPRTKFISLYGARDEVTTSNQYSSSVIEFGSGYVYGKGGMIRLVYDNGNWAEIISYTSAQAHQLGII